MSRDAPKYTRWMNEPNDEDDDQEDQALRVDAPLEMGQEDYDQMQEGRRVLAMMTPKSPDERVGLTRGATARLLFTMGLVTVLCLFGGALIGFIISVKYHSSTPSAQWCAFMTSTTTPPTTTTTTATTTITADISKPSSLVDDGFPQKESLGALAVHLLSHLTPELIRTYVGNVTNMDPSDLKDLVRTTWKSRGFTIEENSFPVMTSTPDVRNPNTVEIVMNNESSKVVNNATESLQGFFPFSGFSPNGSVSGLLVYGRYATKEDFDTLLKQKVAVNGSLLLVRLKEGIHPGVQVRNAEERGVRGVIFYPDPEDFGGNDPNASYPNGLGLPLDGVVWQNLRFIPGDPSTPNHASQKYTYRIPKDQYVGVPSIQVQPVSGYTGRELLSYLGGDVVPDDWKGGLGVDYNFGAAFKGNVTEVRITTNNVLAETHGNVILAYPPAKDHTKVIHIGCHYEIKNGHLTSSGIGLASLLAFGDALAAAFPNGTNRLVAFTVFEGRDGDFSAGNEYSQLLTSWLESSAMAYIDMDEVVEGSGFVDANVSPLLRNTVRDAMKNVAWVGKEALSLYRGLTDAIPLVFPAPSQSASGARDTFSYSYPYECDEAVNFLNVHGIPSIQLTAVSLNKSKTFHLRNSQYDRMDVLINLEDKNLLWTHMIVSAMSVAALSLSASLLPLAGFTELSHDLAAGWDKFLMDERDALNISQPSVQNLIGQITTAISEFGLTCNTYDTWYQNGNDFSDVHTTYEKFRKIESRLVMLMQFGRKFLRPRNVPRHSDFGSLMTYGPSLDDPCEGTYFPVVRKVLKDTIEGRGSWDLVREELSLFLSTLRNIQTET